MTLKSEDITCHTSIILSCASSFLSFRHDFNVGLSLHCLLILLWGLICNRSVLLLRRPRQPWRGTLIVSHDWTHSSCGFSRSSFSLHLSLTYAWCRWCLCEKARPCPHLSVLSFSIKLCQSLHSGTRVLDKSRTSHRRSITSWRAFLRVGEDASHA